MTPDRMTEPGLMTCDRRIGGGAVSGSEDSVAVADVAARGDAEVADLDRSVVGGVVAVQVGNGKHAVVGWANEDLLEDRIRDAVVDEDLGSTARCRATADAGQDGVDLADNFFTKGGRGALDAGLNEGGVSFAERTGF